MSQRYPLFTRGLLPQAPGLQVVNVALTAHDLALDLAMTCATMPCPDCNQPSTRIHSHYHRSLTDLPWAGRTVRIALAVRTFFCTTRSCPRRIFVERLPTLVAPYARKTVRLTDVLRLVGFALGGEAGARLVERLGMAASPRTLLRLLRRTTLPPAGAPRVLGVDEWAFRRGRRYGTILIDLEQHRPVDLLPTSNETDFAAWLRAHPGAAIISRDRGETYATGARQGAPQALQVADRWHLLKNLSEALQKVLARHAAVLRRAAYLAAGLDEPQPVAHTAPPPAPPQRARPRKPPTLSAQQLWQRAMYQRVKELVANGWSVAAMARELKMSKITVRKYRDMEQFTDRRLLVRVSSVEPYRAFVEQRWAEGCTQVKQVWEELQAQGYGGSYKSVWMFTRGWQPPELPVAATPAPTQPHQETRSPRQAMWLLLQDHDQLEPADIAYRAALEQLSPEVDQAAALARAFGHLVRVREVDALDAWLAAAEGSGIRELRRFALGLRQDYAAVRAALEHEWSQGQTEGHVTRLKLLKRQMYGRAKFDLLRLRVLHAG
jgi:transposase